MKVRTKYHVELACGHRGVTWATQHPEGSRLMCGNCAIGKETQSRRARRKVVEAEEAPVR